MFDPEILCACKGKDGRGGDDSKGQNFKINLRNSSTDPLLLILLLPTDRPIISKRIHFHQNTTAVTGQMLTTDGSPSTIIFFHQSFYFFNFFDVWIHEHQLEFVNQQIKNVNSLERVFCGTEEQFVHPQTFYWMLPIAQHTSGVEVWDCEAQLKRGGVITKITTLRLWSLKGCLIVPFINNYVGEWHPLKASQ